MDRILSVNDLAKAGNTTSRAVRLYVAKGLLEPMRVGRVLCFPERAQGTLEKILRAQRLGFSLDEIKTCRRGCDATTLEGAIARIEGLMTDAGLEITDLRRRLARSEKREPRA